jgi:hypothetical protein
MWLLGLAIVALPFLLMIAFNRRELADSRGRRMDHRWRVRR